MWPNLHGPRSSHENNKIEAIFIGKANLPYPIHKPEFSFDKAKFQTILNLKFYNVNVLDLLNIVNSFSSRKASGPDWIPMCSIKESKLIILRDLVHFTNLVIKMHVSIFLDCLKIACVTKKKHTNYWPISVLPAQAKFIYIIYIKYTIISI